MSMWITAALAGAGGLIGLAGIRNNDPRLDGGRAKE
jgi:hypothetical protein